MKALTLWRPWSDAIVHGPKRVENRSWPPPKGTLGTQIAIHAGKTYDPHLKERKSWPWPEDYVPPAPVDSPVGIVGMARLAGYLDRRPDRPNDLRSSRSGPRTRVRRLTCKTFRRTSESANFGAHAAKVHYLDRDPWWAGPVGWYFVDVVALPKPILCPGSPGLWTVPDPIARKVIESLTP